MLNMTQFLNSTVADNTITINGATFKVTDECASKILELCTGMSIASANTKPSAVVPEKQHYVATSDFKPKYEIKEQTAKDGTKLFCISRANGWTRSEKNLMNTAIKGLKNITEIEVEYEKDGVKRSFKAWGYNTEATAKKHLKELPTVFTVAQLNA